MELRAKAGSHFWKVLIALTYHGHDVISTKCQTLQAGTPNLMMEQGPVSASDRTEDGTLTSPY